MEISDQIAQPEKNQTFMDMLSSVSDSINKHEFIQCIAYIDQCTQPRLKKYQQGLLDINKSQLSKYEAVDLISIKAYAMMMSDSNNDIEKALQIIQQCLAILPSHLLSRKRKASILQKMGKKFECKKQYQYCLLLEPESRSIKHKLRRLNMKSDNSSYCEGWSSDSKESSKEYSKQYSIEHQIKTQKTEQSNKPKKPSVKFGNFQIIQINTENSDEHFAIIKQELNKISQKQPKKSILKEPMSASVFKQSPILEFKVEDFVNYNSEQNIEIIEQKLEQVQLHDGNSKLLDLEMEKLEKKKKKKSKSVSFSDSNHTEDFN